MHLFQNELECISNNTFSIDCIEISLTQNTSNPVQYSGSGSIFQNNDGTLELKLYHKYKNTDAEKKFNNNLLSDESAGKLIGKNKLFNLSAEDVFGRLWESSNILVQDPQSPIIAKGQVINAKINSLTCENDRGEKSESVHTFSYALIQGKYDLPFNQYEEIKGTFFSKSQLNIYKLSIRDATCIIHQKDEYLTISVESENPLININKKTEVLLEALGISLGQDLKPDYLKVSSIDKEVLNIFSKKATTNKHTIHPPIPIKILTNDLNHFISLYMDSFKEPSSVFFNYWNRILNGFSGNVENSALVITTSIEGVLKKYYSDRHQPDIEFINEIDKALPLIESMEINTRVKASIKSSFNNSKSIKPKSILHALEKEKVLSIDAVKTWSELRNKASHADTLASEDEAELQKYLDQIFICLGLFYKLLFKHLNYNSNYIDYTKSGWPDRY